MYRFIYSLCLCLGCLASTHAQSDVHLSSKDYFPAEDILMWYKFDYVHNYSVTIPKDLKQGTVSIERWLKHSYSDNDYEFRIVVNEVKDLQKGESKREKGGYVKACTYHFPVSVEVYNEGKLERTFIIVDDTTTFKRDIHAVSFNDKYEAGIPAYLRQQTWIEVAPAISDALSNAYGVYKIPGMGFRFYVIDNPTPEQEKINAIGTAAMNDFNTLWGFSKVDIAVGQIKKHLEEYDQLLQQPALTPNARFLCLYNAAVCALAIDEFDRSVSYYKEYVKLNNAAGLPIIQKDKKSMTPAAAMFKYYYRSFMTKDVKQSDKIHLTYRMPL